MQQMQQKPQIRRQELLNQKCSVRLWGVMGLISNIIQVLVYLTFGYFFRWESNNLDVEQCGQFIQMMSVGKSTLMSPEMWGPAWLSRPMIISAACKQPFDWSVIFKSFSFNLYTIKYQCMVSWRSVMIQCSQHEGGVITSKKDSVVSQPVIQDCKYVKMWPQSYIYNVRQVCSFKFIFIHSLSEIHTCVFC